MPMSITEILRLISVFVLFIAVPLFFYYLLKILKSSKKVTIHANWDDIKKHITLDKLEQKTDSWKKRGYNVEELELLIDQLRKQ